MYLICSFVNDFIEIFEIVDVSSIYYTTAEFTLISLYFLLTFKKNNFKTILKVCYVVYMLVATIYFQVNSGATFDTLSTSVESIFIIVFSILFFYEKLSDIEIIFIYDTKDFWIVSGFLISFSGTLPLFNFFEALPETEGNKSWIIVQIANIFKNVLLGIAFTRPLYKKED